MGDVHEKTEVNRMPRESGKGPGMTKPEIIKNILAENPALPSSQVQAAVWERFNEAVTAQEIAHARRKLKVESTSTPPSQPEPQDVLSAPRVKKARTDKPEPPPEMPKSKRERKPTMRSQPSTFQAKQFASVEVTVGQLSLILEIAEELGGIHHLQNALQTVRKLRKRIGDIDDQQLAHALDFLSRVTTLHNSK